jgi:hypothetical protein
LVRIGTLSSFSAGGRAGFLVVGVRQEHRGEPVEGDDAVRLRVGDRLGIVGQAFFSLRWSAVRRSVHGALPRNTLLVDAEHQWPSHSPLLIHGLKLRVRCSSSNSQDSRNFGIGGQFVAAAAGAAILANTVSAASMPLFSAA